MKNTTHRLAVPLTIIITTCAMLLSSCGLPGFQNGEKSFLESLPKIEGYSDAKLKECSMKMVQTTLDDLAQIPPEHIINSDLEFNGQHVMRVHINSEKGYHALIKQQRYSNANPSKDMLFVAVNTFHERNIPVTDFHDMKPSDIKEAAPNLESTGFVAFEFATKDTTKTPLENFQATNREDLHIHNISSFELANDSIAKTIAQIEDGAISDTEFCDIADFITERILQA